MIEVAANLGRLARLTQTEAPALSAWAETAARRLAAGLDPARALGIDPRSLARGRRADRDRALRAAWVAVSADPDLSDRQRALLLLREVNRFECGLWPRLRDRTEPPPGLSPVQRALFWALRAGNGRLPRYRRLIDLCSEGAD